MVKILKRQDMPTHNQILIRIIAVLLALIVSGFFIAFMNHNPIEVYTAMIRGSLGSYYRFSQSVHKAVPLIIASLGIAVSSKMKFWNVGSEGQILMGAFTTAFVALNFSYIPAPILLPLMLLAGFVGGALWALIPAVFKAYFGTNEILFTLMLNYIALKWITYLQYNLWKDPNAMGFPKIANYPPSAVLPKLFDINIGWIIAIVLVCVVHIFFKYTKRGYEIAVIGESEDTAKYAGMNVKGIILAAIIISGGLSGIVGMIQTAGVSRTLSVDVSGGLGYTAIITTWLARLSPINIVGVCFLFALLIQGGSYIQTALGIHQSAAQIIQAFILFFVLGSEFFIQYTLVLKKEAE